MKISVKCYDVIINRVSDPVIVIGIRFLNYSLNFITARCTLVQSAVLRSHVVCLSVCPSVCLSVCNVGEL